MARRKERFKALPRRGLRAQPGVSTPGGTVISGRRALQGRQKKSCMNRTMA